MSVCHDVQEISGSGEILLPRLYTQILTKRLSSVTAKGRYRCSCPKRNCLGIAEGTCMELKQVIACKQHTYYTLKQKEQVSSVHALIKESLSCNQRKNEICLYISCYHFERSLLDDNMMPYSYITDESLAISVYGEKVNAFKVLTTEKEQFAWYIVPLSFRDKKGIKEVFSGTTVTTPCIGVSSSCSSHTSPSDNSMSPQSIGSQDTDTDTDTSLLGIPKRIFKSVCKSAQKFAKKRKWIPDDGLDRDSKRQRQVILDDPFSIFHSPSESPSQSLQPSFALQSSFQSQSPLPFQYQSPFQCYQSHSPSQSLEQPTLTLTTTAPALLPFTLTSTSTSASTSTSTSTSMPTSTSTATSTAHLTSPSTSSSTSHLEELVVVEDQMANYGALGTRFEEEGNKELLGAIELCLRNFNRNDTQTNLRLNSFALDLLKKSSCDGPFAYLDKSGKEKKADIVILPFNSDLDLTEETSKRYCHKQAKSLQGVLEHFGSHEHQCRVVEQLVTSNTQMGISWLSENKLPLNIFQCIALRDLTHMSNNKVVETCDIIKGLTGIKSVRPPNLRRDIGLLQRARLLSTKFKMVEVSTSKDGSEPCVFSWISQIPLLLERMVASAYYDGSYLDSNEYSNYEDRELIARGIDRGGGDTQDIVRILGRRDGNAGHYCVPISVLEEGAETYENLRKTCLDPESDRNKLFNLIDEKCIFLVTIGCGVDARQGEVRCILLRISSPPDMATPLKCPHDINIKFSIRSAQHDITGGDELRHFEESARSADHRDRTMPDIIAADESMISFENEKATMNLDMILVKETNEETSLDSCIGVRIFHKNAHIYSFKFDREMSIVQRDEVSARSTKVIYLITSDTKLNNTCCGIGSCTANYSCGHCICKTNDKDECLPEYIKGIAEAEMTDWDISRFGPNPLLADDIKYKTFPRRQGDKHVHEAYKQYVKHMGDHGEATCTAVKSTMQKNTEALTNSVSTKPIQSTKIPFESQPPDALHALEGAFNHTNKYCCELIREIEPDPSLDWTDLHIKRVQETIKKIKGSTRYKAAAKKFRDVEKLRTEAATKLTEETDKSNEEIEGLRAQIRTLAESRRSSLKSTFGVANRTLNGLTEMLSSTMTKDSKKKSPTIHNGEYLFRTTVQTFAGNFKKEHGGLDLTCQRGIRCAERRNDIYDIVSKAFENDTATKDKQMRDLMDWWKEIMYHQFEMGNLMKSQKKMTPDRIAKLKKHCVYYVALWLTRCKRKNPIFLKAHLLFCALIPFAEETGMCGIASCEGMENSHFHSKKLKDLHAPIAAVGDRVNNNTFRRQMFLIPEVEQEKAKLKELVERSGRSGPRGPYNVRGARKSEENIEALHTNVGISLEVVEAGIEMKLILGINHVDDDPPFLVETDKGHFLPSEFEDIFNYFTKKKVPSSYHSAINDSERLGTKAKAAGKYAT